MKEQNYSNHRQYVFGFHIITGLLVIAFLGGAITNLIHAPENDIYDAWLILLAGIIFISMFWYLRAFALRAQDRAIRAEEHLRYFLLTGKKIDPKVTMGQIIALRFADDDEFPVLVQKAADDHLSADGIKKLIKNWRGDHHRA